MFFLIERMLVFPAPRAVASRVNASEVNGEDISFQSADGTRLHGWYFPHAKAKGIILYCHGNGIMVPQLGAFASSLRNRSQHSVFVFDYRGYGLSEGEPTEQGVLKDAIAARKWLADSTGVSTDEVVLMGRSLGGAVAVHLAAHGGAKGLILQNTFSSMLDAAAHNYPWLPVRTFMRTRFPSIDLIGKYHGPLLQSHGVADRIVPLAHGQALFRAANSPKYFVSLPGLDHNDPNPGDYDEQLLAFLGTLPSVSDGASVFFR